MMKEGNGGRPDSVSMPDAGDIERAILRIQGIQAARVVPGAGGRISEVHVLAGRERGAKQLVRDVQSVILTNFGVDIDYRTVSIVQLDDAGHSINPIADTSRQEAVVVPAEPRPAIVRLQTETASFTTEVRVAIQVNSHEKAGAARGPSTSGLRLVASATIDAVTDLLNASAVEVQTAELLTVGNVQVAVVVLRLATSRGEQLLTGSAIVRKDANDAIARATLDGLNRVIGAR